MSARFIFFVLRYKSLIVAWAATTCVPLKILEAACLARTQTCFVCSLDEYFNISPFIFNRVTGSQHSTEESVADRGSELP